MFWKTPLHDIEWCSGEFTKQNYQIAVSNQDAIIPIHRSRGIVEKIGPLIPHQRMKFWLECLENDDASDLAANVR